MQDLDLFCKIYVAGADDQSAVSAAVDESIRGGVGEGTGSAGSSVLEIYVDTQSRHLPINDAQDDFTLWRHFIDIDPADANTTFDAFLAELAQLVAGLRARGLRVVAACMFEDELKAAVREVGSA